MTLFIAFVCIAVSSAVDSQRVILRLEEEEGSPDSEYVNTQAGADYINASYLNVITSVRLC